MEHIAHAERTKKKPDYHDHTRAELLTFFPQPPRALLDVGCGAGGTAAAAKERWPACRTVGVELDAEAAERARARLDRVLEVNAETLDLFAEGEREIDAVLLADVLEHLVDPWSFLRRLRAMVRPGAAIVASIPNVANLWLLEEIAAGRFTYTGGGLLDVTHLRFFTRATIGTLFTESGYTIERWSRITDGRVDDLTRRRILGIMLPEYFFGRVAGRRVRVRGVDPEGYQDLRTIQFVVVARAPG
jgi:2-polyprenyl-3-methyl-5-hydroxy-6-metoxy-1,4-benzoquinol methylase